MSFRAGFAGELAKSLDERLKDGMRRTEERADRILERTSIRAEREAERVEKEEREVADLLTAFSNMIDKSQIPEGMTKMDYAAGLYRRGGGTIEGATTYLADLREHQKSGGDVSSLVNYASLKTGGYGEADYINQFVRRPDTLVRVPEGMKGGVGLYGKLFDVDVTEGLQAEIDASFGVQKPVTKFEMDQLQFKEGAKLVGAEEYERQRKKDEVAIQTAEVALERQKKEIAQIGTLGASEVRGFYSDFEDQHVKALGGTRNPDTGDWIAPQGRPDAIKRGIGNALASLSKQAVASNNSHYKPEVQAALVGYAGAAIVNDPPENGKLEIGRVYSKVINGVATKVLYLGYDADGNKIEPVVGQY